MNPPSATDLIIDPSMYRGPKVVTLAGAGASTYGPAVISIVNQCIAAVSGEARKVRGLPEPAQGEHYHPHTKATTAYNPSVLTANVHALFKGTTVKERQSGHKTSAAKQAKKILALGKQKSGMGKQFLSAAAQGLGSDLWNSTKSDTAAEAAIETSVQVQFSEFRREFINLREKLELHGATEEPAWITCCHCKQQNRVNVTISATRRGKKQWKWYAPIGVRAYCQSCRGAWLDCSIVPARLVTGVPMPSARCDRPGCTDPGCAHPRYKVFGPDDFLIGETQDDVLMVLPRELNFAHPVCPNVQWDVAEQAKLGLWRDNGKTIQEHHQMVRAFNTPERQLESVSSGSAIPVLFESLLGADKKKKSKGGHFGGLVKGFMKK